MPWRLWPRGGRGVVSGAVFLLVPGLLWGSALPVGAAEEDGDQPPSLLVRIARVLRGEGGAGEVVRSQRSGAYEVRLTHAPGSPITGKPIRLRIEILDTSRKDPLLGGATPVDDVDLTAALTGGGPDETKIKLERKEAGIFAGQHAVQHSGTHTLTLKGTLPSKESLQVAFALQARRDPVQVRLWGGVLITALLAVVLAVVWSRGGPLRRLAQAGAAVLAILVISVTGVVMLAARESAMHADDHADEGHAEAKGLQIPKELREHVLRTEPVVLGTIRDHIAVNGFVEAPADRIVNVSPRVSGKVVNIMVKPGDRVEAGQILALIDSPQLAQAQAEYSQARARMELAAQELERRKRMADLGAFASRPLEEARKERAQAQSDLEVTEAELAVSRKNQERVKILFDEGIQSRRDLEVAEAAFLSAQARTQQARVRAELARSYVDREQQLFTAGFRSAREVEEAEAEHRKARAQLESAEQALKLLHVSPVMSGGVTEIACPISGVVADRKINVGEVVEPTTVLCTVIDLRTVWVTEKSTSAIWRRSKRACPSR